MKLLITLEVDGTESECEAMLDELDTARQDSELISLISSGGTYEVQLLKVEELPAVGRHKVDHAVHPDQTSILDLIGGGA
jgi:hypothetical protein